MTTSTIAPTPRHDGITITDLTKSYGSTRVLEGITASLAKGKIHGLLGANGVGKTTLLACIANHTFRQAGVITIDGADPRESAEVLARMCFIREDQPVKSALALAGLESAEAAGAARGSGCHCRPRRRSCRAVSARRSPSRFRWRLGPTTPSSTSLTLASTRRHAASSMRSCCRRTPRAWPPIGRAPS